MASRASSPATIVFISGANSGIGLATAKLLASRDSSYHVLIGSREDANGAAAVAELAKEGLTNASHIQLDVTSESSIAAAAEAIALTYGRLDVLINNAGIMFGEPSIIEAGRGGGTLRQQFRETFEVNVFGAACLSNAMLPLLKKSTLPRVVFVSSELGSMTAATDRANPTHQLPLLSYRTSKAALNMLAVTYSMLLEENQGKSNAVCPGLVKSKLNQFNSIGSTPEAGAEIVVNMATLGKDGPTATFSNLGGSLAW
ncbi:Short chain dehydrogenase reductase [Trichoderma simmonsii]|uniref:Short chain dehydrogenase reductase n=1 Tax=Trichoderma simmonsii TaxID=1491479 RepID=A0A8G0LMK8_9HYPO|nr:Short chain dehydrogenase reductase [Trichoderma simmonsii]